MNNKYIKLIEKYIDGDLHDEELILFEKRLKTDHLLVKKYNQRINLAKLWVDTDEYSKTKEQLGTILRKKEMNFFQANRYLIYPIAASIIILAGVYFLLIQDNNFNQNIHKKQFVDVQDSIDKKENTIVFQYDEPYKLTAIDSVDSSTKLLFPINGEVIIISQPITFKWKSDSNKNDTLFVSNESDGKIQLKLRVRLDDTTYTIKYPQFTEGKYLWYISNKTNYGRFSIISK